LIPLDVKDEGVRVWVVTHEVYIMGNLKEPQTVVAVFTTEERAAQYIRAQEFPSDYDKDEYVLDPPESRRATG